MKFRSKFRVVGVWQYSGGVEVVSIQQLQDHDPRVERYLEWRGVTEGDDLLRGMLELHLNDPSFQGLFQLDRDYYVTITPVDDTDGG